MSGTHLSRFIQFDIASLAQCKVYSNNVLCKHICRIPWYLRYESNTAGENWRSSHLSADNEYIQSKIKMKIEIYMLMS